LYHRGARAISFQPLRDVKSLKIETLEEFKASLTSLDYGDTVVLVGGAKEGWVFRYREVFRSLRDSRAMITALAFGAVPAPQRMQRTGVRARRLLSRVQLVIRRPEALNEWIFRAWDRAIAKRILPKPSTLMDVSLDAIYAGVDETEISPLLRSERTRVLMIHELDYELAQQADRSTHREDESQIVFLDFGGQDNQLLRIKPRAPMKRQVEVVAGALTAIESATGLPVVVAVHPRSGKSRFEPFFQRKALVHGQTPKLTSSSRGVISAFGSTAISYAVFYRKPLVMLDLPELGESHRAMCQTYEEMLGALVVDATRPITEWNWPEVDEDKYRAYSERYLKRSNSIRGRFWGIVASDIGRNAKLIQT